MSDITLIHILYTADPTASPAVSEAYDTLKADPNGALWIRPVATLGAGFGVQTSRVPSADAVVSAGVVAFDVASFNFVYDENAGTWDRERLSAILDNSTFTKAVVSQSILLGFDGATYDRIKTGANNADTVAEQSTGVLQVGGYLYGFNGADWNRLISGGNAADGVATSAIGVLKTGSFLHGYNGVTYDRIKSAGNNTDQVTQTVRGLMMTLSHMMGWDSDNSQWNRIRANDDASDNVSVNNSNNILLSANRNYAFNGTTYDRVRSSGNDSDNHAALSIGHLDVLSSSTQYNETDWERVRGNTSFDVFPSAAYTATQNSGNLINRNGRGALLTIDVTAYPAAASVIFTIQAYDKTSGKYTTILASVAITGVGTTELHIYPGLAKTAGVEENHVLPRDYRILATHTGADSITYSVGAQIII